MVALSEDMNASSDGKLMSGDSDGSMKESIGTETRIDEADTIDEETLPLGGTVSARGQSSTSMQESLPQTEVQHADFSTSETINSKQLPTGQTSSQENDRSALLKSQESVGEYNDQPESTIPKPSTLKATPSYQSLEAEFRNAEQGNTSPSTSGKSPQDEAEQPARKGRRAMSMDSSPSTTDSDVPMQVIVPRMHHSSLKSKHGTALRRGKWTVEEEAYVARVIQDFNSGFLDAPAGTTLRTYLSEKLQCDPMRITKKFTGDACIGKRVFHPAVRSPSNSSAIDKAQAELETLERRWRRRLEMQQRESAKKAAASAAAAAGSAGRGRFTSSTSLDVDVESNPQAMVTKTASWLDRAKSILKDPHETGSSSPNSGDDTENDLQNQMDEVEKLIQEGPVIQETSAGLTSIIDHAQVLPPGSPASVDLEPADKRMRTAEDAEALVGFLRSVRASAASGENF